MVTGRRWYWWYWWCWWCWRWYNDNDDNDDDDDDDNDDDNHDDDDDDDDNRDKKISFSILKHFMETLHSVCISYIHFSKKEKPIIFHKKKSFCSVGKGVKQKVIKMNFWLVKRALENRYYSYDRYLSIIIFFNLNDFADRVPIPKRRFI